MWHANEYTKVKIRFQSLNVVNDATERGISIILPYNESDIITRNEEQKQFLLQIVEEHRCKFPDTKKSVLVKYKGV